MNLSNLKITEIIAIGTVISGAGLATMKFYHSFNNMIDTLSRLQSSIDRILNQNVKHEDRLTRLEEQSLKFMEMFNSEENKIDKIFNQNARHEEQIARLDERLKNWRKKYEQD